MKKILNIFLFALMVGAGTTVSTEAKSQAASVSFSVFYSSLKPYGRWMNNSTYGRVWVSNTRNFTPYSTGGHWAYTNDGWTWVSDYDWGWATFHYGRWSYHYKYGWYWVPGYEWAPAWVAWRNSNDYSGWAPLSPGLNISIGVSAYNSIPSGRWVFAPTRYITRPDVNRYYVPRTQNVTIIRRTNIVNNVTVRGNVRYVAGPRREDVERVTHTKIQTYTVSNASRPGKTVVNHNTINVYRPVTNNKTVVNNDNSKTTINKNSNNKTVNKNSNNKTVTNNNTKNTDVTKNSNNNNNNKTKKNTTKKTTNNTTDKTTNNKTDKTTNNQTINKKPNQNKKPATPPSNNNQTNNNKQKARQAAQNAKVQQHKQQVKQQASKKKNPNDGRNQK